AICVVVAYVGATAMWARRALADRRHNTLAVSTALAPSRVDLPPKESDKGIRERSGIEHLNGQRARFLGEVVVIGYDMNGWTRIFDKIGRGEKTIGSNERLGTLVILNWNFAASSMAVEGWKESRIYCFFDEMSKDDIQATGLDPTNKQKMDAV